MSAIVLTEEEEAAILAAYIIARIQDQSRFYHFWRYWV